MSDLISREVAVLTMRNMANPDEAAEFEAILRNVPAVDVELVRHGNALAYIRELEAKVAEYEKPLMPLTLDEVIEKSKRLSDNVIWLEQPDEEYGYDDTECIPALLSNFSRVGASDIQYVKFLVWPKNEIVFPVINESDYGETWRCWSRRPTGKERRTAKWKMI